MPFAEKPTNTCPQGENPLGHAPPLVLKSCWTKTKSPDEHTPGALPGGHANTFGTRMALMSNVIPLMVMNDVPPVYPARGGVRPVWFDARKSCVVPLVPIAPKIRSEGAFTVKVSLGAAGPGLHTSGEAL